MSDAASSPSATSGVRAELTRITVVPFVGPVLSMPLLGSLLSIAAVAAIVGAVIAGIVALGVVRAVGLLAGSLTAIVSLQLILTRPAVLLIDDRGQCYIAPIPRQRANRAAELSVGGASVVAGVVVAIDVFRGFTYDPLLRAALAFVAATALVKLVIFMSNRGELRTSIETWQQAPRVKPPRAVSMDQEGGVAFNWSPGLPFPGANTSGFLDPLRELFWRELPPEWALRGLMFRTLFTASFFAAAAAFAAVGDGILRVTKVPAHIVAIVGIPAYCALLLVRRLWGLVH
jgi:hypothetical protein